ncbi:MAG: DUF2634 domain-containing protein [Vulcanibacillus sp.]
MPQSLLPSSNLYDLDTSINKISPSKTWLVKNNRLLGFTNGQEAIKQSIQAMLSTSRFEHLIYSWNYGQELSKLIGKEKSFIKVEAPRIIKECLIQDDRISDVVNFVFSDTEDGLLIEFEVIASEGVIESEVVL